MACASAGCAAREYDDLVDEFISAACDVFPGVLIQFEDFANHNAFRLLRKYRDQICAFNDDIQGTAAVALAGIFSALRVTGGKLADQTLLFLGAGEAATGIADLVVSAMVAQGAPSRRRGGATGWWILRGLVVQERADLAEHKLPYAHEHAPIGDFLTAIRALKPTAIIGVAAVGGTFTGEVLQAMAELNRAADRVRALQPHLEGGMHRRGSLPLTLAGKRCSHAAVPTTRCSCTAAPSCRARATTPTSSRALASA